MNNVKKGDTLLCVAPTSSRINTDDVCKVYSISNVSCRVFDVPMCIKCQYQNKRFLWMENKTSVNSVEPCLFINLTPYLHKNLE